MNQPPSPQAFGPTINRVSDLMAHTTKYSFWGVARLAEDARVSSAAVSRLINGKMNPSFAMAARLTAALEREFGFSIDPRDLFAENGKFLTCFACDLAACSGCLPERAMDEYGDLKSTFVGVQKGHWVTSMYPNGFQQSKGGR